MDDEQPDTGDMTWWTYVQRHAAGARNAHIAAAIGITPSSVGRWSSGSNPDPAQAAAFARAYGRPVLEAFVAAGFLTPREAGERPAAAPSLATLSDIDLINEVWSRMTGGESGGLDIPEKMDDGVVTPIRPEGMRRKVAREADVPDKQD